MQVTITAKAAQKVKEFLTEQQKPTYGLRMSVIGGGCSGFQYDVGIEAEPASDDTVLESEGVKIFIDPVSAPYLENAELDYVDALTGSGFKFTNPNAKKSCGCGSSFSV